MTDTAEALLRFVAAENDCSPDQLLTSINHLDRGGDDCEWVAFVPQVAADLWGELPI